MMLGLTSSEVVLGGVDGVRFGIPWCQWRLGSLVNPSHGKELTPGTGGRFWLWLQRKKILHRTHKCIPGT